jgi:PelA/Pel-15E family pectate lyase
MFVGLVTFCCKPDKKYSAIDLSKFNDGIHHWNLFHNQDLFKRYSEHQITKIADNLVQYQNEDGGWPKNIDWLAIINIDSLKSSLPDKQKQSTIDNCNTYSQIEYLSKVYKVTKNQQYKKSAEKGLKYLLNTQNKSGGWRGWDVDAITFNDLVMTGVMHLFLDIIEQREPYYWVKGELYNSIENALQKAIDVTLKCQIVNNGEKTAWCQQHDHTSLLPVKARSYELPSICSRESVDVVRFLMRLPDPDPEIIESVTSAMQWLEKSKIYGIRLERIKLEKKDIINDEYPYDLIVVNDSTAEPVWSRYYEIATNKPFLCRRDGTVVYSLKEISPERRTGYAWYGYWPTEAILKEYPKWLSNQNLR